MNEAQRERRFKRVHVPQDMIVMLITGIRHELIQVPIRPDLPADCTVISVHYAIESIGFSVCLWSGEWDIVLEGEMVPRLKDVEFNVVEIRQGTDGKWGVAEENPLTPDTKCGDCDHRTTDRCPFCVDDNHTRVACVKHTPMSFAEDNSDDGRYEIGCS